MSPVEDCPACTRPQANQNYQKQAKETYIQTKRSSCYIGKTGLEGYFYLGRKIKVSHGFIDKEAYKSKKVIHYTIYSFMIYLLEKLTSPLISAIFHFSQLEGAQYK